MNAITAGKRSFAVAGLTALLLASLVALGQTLLADGGTEPATSVSTALPQVEEQPEAERPADGDDSTVEGDPTVGDLVDQLEADGLTETFDVYLSRDPFQPVVVQTTGDGSGDGSGGGSTDGGSTDGGSTDGGSTDGSAGGNDDGTACSGSGGEAVCEGVVVTMTGFTDAGEALIEVDGVLYTVVAGDVFATSFQVERLDEGSGCAFLRYGDEAFTICTGATVLK